MWVIIGRSEYGDEILDTAETRGDARYLVQEYRIAFGAGWSISMRRARRGEEVVA